MGTDRGVLVAWGMQGLFWGTAPEREGAPRLHFFFMGFFQPFPQLLGKKRRQALLEET